MTTPGLSWAAVTGSETVEDWAGARLVSRWGADGTDYDLQGLAVELREMINDGLPTGWALDGNRFVGPTPVPEDALDAIRETIDEIDFWGTAQYYDNGD